MNLNFDLEKATLANPGDYILQILNNLNEVENDTYAKLHSIYPWRSENHEIKSEFMKKALKDLNNELEIQEVYEMQGVDSRKVFRYARPIIMQTSCVACHNRAPESPKKDWRLGNIIAILEYSRNLDEVYLTTDADFQETFLLLGVREILFIIAVKVVLDNLNKINKNLELRIKERTLFLEEANQDLAQRNTLIRQIFGRYLSDEIVANLLESPNSLNLGGERRKITILTSDLRGFTSISEHLSAEEVITVLNIYLERMASVINNNGGTINEIMGDGILVLFGAPTEREDDVMRAITCGLEMQLAMPAINQKLKKLGFPELEMGIGINTSLVVLGNICSEKRTKYGVIGSQVNLTYRIESYSLGGEILLAESTYEECGDQALVRNQRQAQAKGVKEKLTLYELAGIKNKPDLYLPLIPEEFILLDRPILCQYQALDGKHVDQDLFQGQITEFSRKGAKIVTESSETPMAFEAFTNIKLNLCGVENHEDNEDIYAKVSDRRANLGSFYVNFTTKSKRLRILLGQMFVN